MKFELIKFLKAATLCAAFLFASVLNAGPNITSFENIKVKTTELLIQKKKSQALQLLSNYLKFDLNSNIKAEASELLIHVALKFTTKEAQDAYESSINLTLENPAEAKKLNDICISIEPQNLDCLIQKTRLFWRLKKQTEAVQAALEIKEIIGGSSHDLWLEMYLTKQQPEFKNKIITKKNTSTPSDENFMYLYLELDRCFLAKNYSKAKEIINYFDKNYADWPDLVYYKDKINIESAENKKKINNDSAGAVYLNKCKSLSKNVNRKYRYDFALCLRGG